MKYLYLITLTLFLLSTNANAQCPGTVVHSQKELDSLFAGCITTIGSLSLGVDGVENDIHDLSALKDMWEVGGNLFIRNTQLVDLNQLTELLFVKGSIFIHNNAHLVNIHLEKFFSLDFNFEVINCPLLESLSGHFPPHLDLGFVKILNNPQLQNVNIFDNFKHSNGAIIINNCPRLKNLDGLKNLQKTKILSLQNCDSLSDLSHLSNLRISNDIELLNLPIQKLDFLNQVDSLTWFTIAECRQLKDISGLKGWDAGIQYFTFNNTDSLRSMAPFDSLRIWKELLIEDHQALDTLGFNTMDNPIEEIIIQNTALKKLNGLQNLKRVNHWLEISDHPQLQDLSDLNKLERMERDVPGLNSYGIVLSDLPDLRTQNFLPKLEFCSGQLQIKNCGIEALGYFDALLEGSTRIFLLGCLNLKYINAFNQLEELQYLSIRDNPNLEIIEGFNKLKRASLGIEISNNSILKRTNCFDKINFTPFSFNSNPLLLDILIFSSYQHSGGAIGIINMPFEHIDFLPNLDTISTLNIHSNQNLKTLEGLSYPIYNIENTNTVFQGIWIKDNKQLANFKGLDSIKHLTESYLTIENNEGLESLDGLNNITIVGDDVHIHNNPDLKDLNGIHQIKFIAEALEIKNNPQLTDISGLAALDTIVEYLEISDNPLLSDCEVLCTIDEDTFIGDFQGLKLFGNGETCNDIRNILEICANDTTSVTTTYPELNNLRVYPNPTNSYLFLELDQNQKVRVLIFDQLGQLVEEFYSDAERVVTLDVSGYQSGFYSGRVELLGQRKMLGKFRWVKI